ncbi:phosphoenolpyruvate carboxykinase (ATP) [Fluviispira multicolorata]|uniref:Phosphoenolpyruvate carboxykinase (ATP) n=1 Tax=Fluviispira multicolorata TaxID=2654512 RepID=A0A833JH68_9BACT|nr:phosphoenolpyruvate carboxykinase (ATP) [Fluviispira multicolorata]KAB8033227.1 phosphoenolpyruvate carboxykinase (ATP) [Fluviispira multicolorata]
MLKKYGLVHNKIYHNTSIPIIYEHSIHFENNSFLTDSGALVAFSGEKTGRSPKDKRIVKHPESELNIDWGEVNIAQSQTSFVACKQRALDYLSTKENLYVVDGYAGWDKSYQIKVRVICSRPYHALFMHNMLIRPTPEELKNFGEPDCVIFNAGSHCADDHAEGMTSKTSISFHFEQKEIVILGTDYAGEMKKGVFTVMNYLMPKKKVLSLHCSVNEGAQEGDISIFLGLSGTGKTTLSADPNRKLIGDDEHCWSDSGIFNIEGGCYAKCDHLSREKEPEIFGAIKFGTLLENIVADPNTRKVDYSDLSITENTRASYKIEYIENAKIPCTTNHANNIIFLTCDAFGVLPPVSLLTPEQAMYHFMSGYTAKIAGTEVGIKEPKATFSACFGAPFMVWHPIKYAELLAQKMREHSTQAWLVNTGWTAGGYGEGERISLKYTRSILNAIHSGELINEGFENFAVFNFKIPRQIRSIPTQILNPRNTWSDKNNYDLNRIKIANMFIDNFKKFVQKTSQDVLKAGPDIECN